MREDFKDRFRKGLDLILESKRFSWYRIFRAKSLWILLLLFVFLYSSGYRFSKYSPNLTSIQRGWKEKYLSGEEASEEKISLQKNLKRENRSLKNKLKNLMPRGKFIVIDSLYNRLYLREGKKTLLDAVCSAGSGAVLVDTPGGRKWIFDTPRGEFQILNKKENPVWTKPDWAFIEEGEPIPDSLSERIEHGVLGEYALYFSTDGYLIHGTLYERLLGRSVTHGCIRLGRKDLRILYHSTRLGTKVYIY